MQLSKRKEMLAKIATGGRWYDIRNAAGPVAEIRIYEEIGWFGVTAEDFVRELDEVTAPEITVAINCPGGDVFDGIAIYNALRVHPAKVTTRVDSLAASAASVIVQAGDERVMLSGSQMMIHEAWGISIGTAADMREFADLLDRQSDVIAGIYASRSGRETSHYRELMAGGDAWLTDSQAVEEGLADQVSDPGPAEQQAAAAANGRRLSEQIASVLTESDELVDRLAEVVTLRTDQGKAVDDTWRTRSDVDRLKAQMERLSALLDEQDGETTDPDEERVLDREYARFVQITQGV
ncbi:MAG: head maturation protease, ClpP-related [Actinomycetota bacterium]